MAQDIFSTVALVTAAAAVAPIVAALVPRRILPIIVAEIALGMILGQSGFRLIEPNPTLELLSWLGFAMLMFASGLEIDLKLLIPGDRPASRAGPGQPLAWSFAIALGTFALSVAGAYAVWGDSRPTSHLLFLALVLSTTSVGIVVPTLKERGLTATSYGQIVLAAALLADLLTMLLVSVLAAFLSGGDLARGWWPVVFVVATASVGVIAGRLGASAALRAFVARLDAPTGRLPLRAAMALLFVLALVAARMSAELVLAAFLAGIIVGAMTRRGAGVPAQVETLGYGFLIPMFFFGVGVGFDLPALLSSRDTLLAMPALIALAYLNKIMPMLPLRRHFSWNEVVSGGLLLSSRLSLIIAAAAIGLRVGVLDTALNSAMILLAVVTALVSPTLFNLVSSRARPGTEPTTRLAPAPQPWARE